MEPLGLEESCPEEELKWLSALLAKAQPDHLLEFINQWMEILSYTRKSWSYLGAVKPEKGQTWGGVSANRTCACCGTVMEQNEPDAPVVGTEYCSQCGREPLCAACANGVVGWPTPIDMRWARLTYRAANEFPRTAGGGPSEGG